MIADDVIAEIRERVDIVALVGEYVTLKQRGGNHVGLCPFHGEKTPSFNVRGAHKYFHCFGCKESGDAFAFLMRIEGLSFPEAARALAQRVGVEIPEGDGVDDREQRREREHRERLYATLEAAARFYEKALSSPAAACAREELGRRGVSAESAGHFRLGYAPDAWDALSKELASRRVSAEDAQTVGLVVPRRSGSGEYDRFRHRLVFPITDVAGRVVGFSGRALPGGNQRGDREEPKYVNSPEGPLYRKGELLYGLHAARVALRRNGWALLCEGNFDLVALHQAGFDNAVAPLGTALTAAQARLLKRFAQRVTLLFDGDSAGAKAVEAAHGVLRHEQITARVATLPTGDDPDSFLRREGADALRARLDAAPGIVEWLIDRAAETCGPSAADRAAAVQGLGPVLSLVENSVEERMYAERIAQRFGVDDPEIILRQARRGRSGPPAAKRQPMGVASSQGSARLPRLQAEVLGILIENPALFETPAAAQVEAYLTHPGLRDIFETAAAQSRETGALDATALLSSAADGPAQSWLRGRLAVSRPGDDDGGAEALRQGIAVLAKRHYQEHERPRLEREIAAARREGDAHRADMLIRERDELARTYTR